METKTIPKGRKITAWILVGLMTALLLLSGLGKIMASGDAESEMYKNFVKWGLEGRLLMIAIGEIIATVLFLMPKTSSIGVLLLSAHFGGAIATHLENGEMFIPQFIMLLVIWVANWLRNPEMLASLKK